MFDPPFPLAPIQSRTELEQAYKVINDLLDLGDLTANEDKYLDELSDLVWEYEQTLPKEPCEWGVMSPLDLILTFVTEEMMGELLEAGRITLNGRVISDPTLEIEMRAGDTLTLGDRTVTLPD